MHVVHCKREPYTIYIGRPGPFGNPHPIGWCVRCRARHTRDDAIAAYRAGLTDADVARIVALPADAVLGCWCEPKPCHGSVIIDVWQQYHGRDD